MPNGLISGASVLNYSQGTALTMLNIEVGVAYGSDTALVAALLTHAVEVQKEIVHDAPILVVFDAFGSSSLDFKVRCSVRSPWDRERIQSEIRFRIDQSFRKAGVHIPFPQQDLYVKSWPENLAPSPKGESPSSED
jgi:small-conductance mechanosensitive channel